MGRLPEGGLAVQNDGGTISVGAIVPDTLEGCFLIDDFTVAPKK